MQNSTRRTFIQAGAAMAVGAQANRILGANDRINVAVIGLGGRGTNHVDSYVKIETAHLAGLCDVNQAALEKAQARVQRATQATPKGYDDMRKVFEDKSIDAVSFATPNHWHALGAIWAMQAGKDVYCEKPASHNLFENAQMIAAARKYGRMCQIGSQWRTIEHCQKAVKMLGEGVIGKVYLAKGLCYKVRRSIGKKPDSPTPPGVDWSQFLGPAPMRPFNELRFRYNWHWFWDTGNGDLGNQGVHQTDIVMWGLGITGDVTFCTSFLQAYQTLGLDVPKYLIATCVDATIIDSLGPVLAGSYLATTVTGDSADADLYAAMLEKYAPDEDIDPDPIISTGISAGVGSVISFVRALDGLSGDVTAATVLAALDNAKDVPLFLGDGITYTCDGSAIPMLPNVCSAQFQVGVLDENGEVTDATTVEASDLFVMPGG